MNFYPFQGIWNFFFSYFIQSRCFLSVAYLTEANLARLGISVHCQVSVRSNIQSGSSPRAGLQVVTQSIHLSKDCYPQLLSNPHCSKIRLPKQLDYKCMPPHLPLRHLKRHLVFKVLTESKVFYFSKKDYNKD